MGFRPVMTSGYDKRGNTVPSASTEWKNIFPRLQGLSFSLRGSDEIPNACCLIPMIVTKSALVTMDT